jgi:hypothetical protein
VTIAPKEILPFEFIILVLKSLLVVPAACGLIELTPDIGPPETGWGVDLMVPVTKLFLFAD